MLSLPTVRSSCCCLVFLYMTLSEQPQWANCRFEVDVLATAGHGLHAGGQFLDAANLCHRYSNYTLVCCDSEVFKNLFFFFLFFLFMCETAHKQSGLCVIVATSAIYVLVIRCWYVTVVWQSHTYLCCVDVAAVYCSRLDHDKKYGTSPQRGYCSSKHLWCAFMEGTDTILALYGNTAVNTFIFSCFGKDSGSRPCTCALSKFNRLFYHVKDHSCLPLW